MLLQLYWREYAAKTAQPKYVHRAAYLLAHCKTSILGGHVVRCPHGHVEEVHYNCCRHRFCPRCSAAPRREWLAKWTELMLPTPSRHIVFTCPQDLVPIWKHNKESFADCLFQAAKESLLELLADPKYLGAMPGILEVLHTWSQTLAAHPHCHCIVTCGGYAEDGRWKNPVKDCLLPRVVLMTVFRGKFLIRIQRLSRLKRFVYPKGWDASRLSGTIHRLFQIPWNVKILERYDNANGVVKYLARYLRGGPIGNSRLVSIRDGCVTFRYKNRRDVKNIRKETTEVSIDEFLNRWANHIPPHGLQTVRAYGLYASSNRSKLESMRALFPPPKKTEAPTSQLEPIQKEQPQVCPTCGSKLETKELERPSDHRAWRFGESVLPRRRSRSPPRLNTAIAI